MLSLPDDLTRLKGGIRPASAGGAWTPDPDAAWIIADLEKSGIHPVAAAANRLAYTSCQDRIAELLNRRTSLPGGHCLVIPYFDSAGNNLNYCRLKPELPRCEHRDGENRPVKYDAASGCRSRLYIPPVAVPDLLDPKALLIVTEGEKKAIALNQHGFLAVAVAGVWNLLKKVDGVDKGKTFEDYEFGWPDDVPVAGRLIILLFDSDTQSKGNLPLALKYIRQHLAARGATVRVARLPDGPNGKKMGADDYLVADGPAALQQILDAATDPADRPRPAKEKKEKKEKDPAAAEILTLIGTGFDLWHDPEDRAYASAGRRTYPVKSKAFRMLLVTRYRQKTGGKVPNAEALSAALLALEGIAVHDRPAFDAHIRVAEHDGRVYVHLANSDDTVIEVGPDGWRDCPDPPVRFVRVKGMRPLPRPARGGDLEALRWFINCPDDAAFALARAWLAQVFRANGPFPLLVLLGEQGSAKSTTAKVLKRLIDPRELDVRAEPKEVRDLMIACQSNWVLAFDNLSHLPAWLSDALCRLATGGGFGTRGLYTDDEEQTFTAKRPVVLNGIEDFVTRPDLLERSLLIQHPAIHEDKRKPEKVLWAEFDAAAPGLLGALFDYVAGGLRELSNVEVPRLPRMADFALFAVACEVARTGSGEAFLQAYKDNQAGANEQVLDDSPVAATVIRFMAERVEWEGTPTDLHKALTALIPEADRKDKEWPKKANSLSGKLKRLAPSLRRAAGIDVQLGVRGTDRTRTRHTVLRRLRHQSRDESSGSSANAGAPPNPADDVTDGQPATDCPLVVHLPSATDTRRQLPAPSADGPDGADGLSGSSSVRPPDPPTSPSGGRRRGRV
jgi:hypothetical protein